MKKLSLFFGMILFSGICHGQSISTDEMNANQLYQKGYTAYTERKYVEALAYLYACLQKAPAMVKEYKIQEAIAYAQSQIRVTRVQGSTNSSGLIKPPPSLSVVPQNTPKTYPLVIRGNNNIEFILIRQEEYSYLQIAFKKAPKGVGMNKENQHLLKPQEAAWLDRSIGKNEPNIILIPLSTGFRAEYKNSKLNINEEFFQSLTDSTKYQTFNTYNDSNGRFIVVKN